MRLASQVEYASCLTSQLEYPRSSRWSMGAIIVLETITRLKVAVAKAVAISGTARFCSTRDYPAGTPEKNIRAMKMGLVDRSDELLRTFFRLAAFPESPDADVIDSRVEQCARLGVDTLIRGLDYLHRTDLRDAVHDAVPPVLILHGRHDRIIPWQAGEFLGQQIPKNRFALYEDVGHHLPLDQPESVASDIKAFLAEKD